MLINVTRRKILAHEYTLCTTNLSQAWGLMFSKRRTLVMTFPTERIVPLHMFFVFYPIDVLFLDRTKKIVEIKESFKPFCFYTPRCPACYVIELPAGVIQKTRTAVGDVLRF